MRAYDHTSKNYVNAIHEAINSPTPRPLPDIGPKSYALYTADMPYESPCRNEPVIMRTVLRYDTVRYEYRIEGVIGNGKFYDLDLYGDEDPAPFITDYFAFHRALGDRYVGILHTKLDDLYRQTIEEGDYPTAIKGDTTFDHDRHDSNAKYENIYVRPLDAAYAQWVADYRGEESSNQIAEKLVPATDTGGILECVLAFGDEYVEELAEWNITHHPELVREYVAARAQAENILAEVKGNANAEDAWRFREAVKDAKAEYVKTCRVLNRDGNPDDDWEQLAFECPAPTNAGEGFNRYPSLFLVDECWNPRHLEVRREPMPFAAAKVRGKIVWRAHDCEG